MNRKTFPFDQSLSFAIPIENPLTKNLRQSFLHKDREMERDERWRKSNGRTEMNDLHSIQGIKYITAQYTPAHKKMLIQNKSFYSTHFVLNSKD